MSSSSDLGNLHQRPVCPSDAGRADRHGLAAFLIFVFRSCSGKGTFGCFLRMHAELPDLANKNPRHPVHFEFLVSNECAVGFSVNPVPGTGFYLGLHARPSEVPAMLLTPCRLPAGGPSSRAFSGKTPGSTTLVTSRGSPSCVLRTSPPELGIWLSLGTGLRSF